MKKRLLVSVLLFIISLVSCSKQNDYPTRNNKRASDANSRAIDENIEIPDANFKSYLLQNLDSNNDGQISTNEVREVTILSVGGKEIQSLEGIEFFPNLTELWCMHNNLTYIDISNNTQLHRLYCNENDISTINIGNNDKLTSIRCNNNSLYSLDLSKCISLYELWCGDNKFTNLDVSRNAALSYLDTGSTLKKLTLKEGQYIYRLITLAEIVYIN